MDRQTDFKHLGILEKWPDRVDAYFVEAEKITTLCRGNLHERDFVQMPLAERRTRLGVKADDFLMGEVRDGLLSLLGSVDDSDSGGIRLYGHGGYSLLAYAHYVSGPVCHWCCHWLQRYEFFCDNEPICADGFIKPS